MANVQKYFLEFHDRIRLGPYEEEETLRDKRDKIVNKLKERLPRLFKDKNEDPPSFETFDQGSYAMRTANKPLDGDYDIDVGVEFDIYKEDYPDPLEVKSWVYDALCGHTDDVRIKTPCVTVQYHIEKEPVYHVDLPVYARSKQNPGILYLAKGKLHSSSQNKIWEPSEPKKFIKLVGSKCANEDDRKQFRRIIRYLKRWKDMKFSADGNAAPVGIGLTVATYNWFQPQYCMVDVIANRREYNDLVALRNVVDQMLSHFVNVHSNDGGAARRLQVFLPVQPCDDPFRRMSDLQMQAFEKRLECLRDALDSALEDEDPHSACLTLQRQFGDEFPVPDPADTAERQKSPAILTSSESA